MELNLIITILSRHQGEKYVELCKERELPMTVSMLGEGTANVETLNILGLESSEKTVVLTVANAEKRGRLFKDMRNRFYIDIPGNGIMLAVPIKSVGGGRTFAYLTDTNVPETGGFEMNYDYELILVIFNEGYTEDVMDAARSAKASGGTVVHAKGTGAERAKKFFGVSLAEEKQIILIVSKSSEKSDIMKAIVRDVGPGTKAGAITFSLPVTEIAGLRLLENDE